MPELVTGSADRRRQSHLPTREVAGEVTKKIIDLKDQAEPPPTFAKPKIGGAVDFLNQQELDVEHRGNGDTEEGDLRGIGGISAENFVSSQPSDRELEREHPLAAPPGWRRFWGVVEWENRFMPDIILSPFCKHCYDKGLTKICRVARTGHELESRRCRTVHDGHCLYVISYQPHPIEDVSIDSIPEYRLRKLARERLETIGTPLEIPTAKTERSLFIRAPPSPTATVETVAVRQEPIAPKPHPTDSQGRSSCGDLSVKNHQEKKYQNTNSKHNGETGLPKPYSSPSAPTWVQDMENFLAVPYGRGPSSTIYLDPKKYKFQAYELTRQLPIPESKVPMRGTTLEEVLSGVSSHASSDQESPIRSLENSEMDKSPRAERVIIEDVE